MSHREVPQRETPIPDLDKEVVRLPDGRELTYYRFPQEPARPAPGSGPAAPAGKER